MGEGTSGTAAMEKEHVLKNVSPKGWSEAGEGDVHGAWGPRRWRKPHVSPCENTALQTRQPEAREGGGDRNAVQMHFTLYFHLSLSYASLFLI